MTKDEIMKEYTEELKRKSEIYDNIQESWGSYFFYEEHIKARDNLHKKAMECLNKVLTPELKIIFKNFCTNKLGYPDEVIFYKVFGDEPEIGKSISKTELEEKGIDINEFEKMVDYWCWEGNIVEKETVGENDYYYLNALCERPNITTELEEERLKASVALKSEILNNNRISEADQDKFIQYIDILLHGLTPEQIKEKKLKKLFQEIYNNPDIFNSLEKEHQEIIKNVLKQ